MNSGVTVEDVGVLVRHEIVPHYARLSPQVVLQLEAVEGEASVLAIQRWPDCKSFDDTFSHPSFQRWWEEYQPILRRWDALVTFDSEWSTEDVL
jgi:hypothetical protein